MREKENSDFPYSMGIICYFEVDCSGNISCVPHKNKSDQVRVLEAYQRAKIKLQPYMRYRASGSVYS